MMLLLSMDLEVPLLGDRKQHQRHGHTQSKDDSNYRCLTSLAKEDAVHASGERKLSPLS